MNYHDAPGDAARATPAATIELLTSHDLDWSACAVLTPAIRARLREMEPGQVLLVRTDDPAAPLDVVAWCGLTGNAMRAEQDRDGVFNFYIEKQDRKQEVRGNG